MNSEEKKKLEKAEFHIDNQLKVLQLTGKLENMTLCIPPTLGKIKEEYLKEILRRKFPTENVNFEFEYIGSNPNNETTLIYIKN